MNRALPLVFGLFAACSSQIQHGLDEREANEIVSVLTARGFDAQKVSEKGKKPTWAIEVADATATEAMRTLAELKLPRPAKLTTSKLASESSLIETAGTERLRHLEAQEGDIEQALETIDGVTSASVELVVPAPARPGAQSNPSKASVLLRVTTASAEHINRQRADLRALVAASVDGLTSDDVVLVIDEIESQMHATPIEKPRALRGVIIGLAALVVVLAASLFKVTKTMKKARHPVVRKTATQPPPPPRSTPPMPRPVIATAVKRAAS